MRMSRINQFLTLAMTVGSVAAAGSNDGSKNGSMAAGISAGLTILGSVLACCAYCCCRGRASGYNGSGFRYAGTTQAADLEAGITTEQHAGNNAEEGSTLINPRTTAAFK